MSLTLSRNPFTALKRAIINNEPFGAGGQRILFGGELGPYYGFCGAAPAPNGNVVLIYRKSIKHGIKDNAELRCAIYDSKIETLISDALLYQNLISDARPDQPYAMANGRIGVMVNRQDEGSTHFDPLFLYSDDSGVTWTVTEIDLAAPYTFQATGGIIELPASQGGHDTLGYCSFGYADGNGVDMLKTLDNGITWSIVSDVAVGDGTLIQPIGGVSENVYVRVARQDKWIIFARSKDAVTGAWNDELYCFVTTDLNNWGLPRDTGLKQGGNPPAVVYDPLKNKITYMLTPRGGRGIDGYPEDSLLAATADADALFNANGNFTSLGVAYRVLAKTPHWTTGYLNTFRSNGKLYGTYTAGESGVSEENASSIILIGDFISSDADKSIFNELCNRRRWDDREYTLVARDNLISANLFTLYNYAKTAFVKMNAYRTQINTGGGEYDILPYNDIVIKQTDTADRFTFKSQSNSNDNYFLRVESNSGAAAWNIGGYGISHTGGANFTCTFSGDLVFNADNIQCNDLVKIHGGLRLGDGNQTLTKSLRASSVIDFSSVAAGAEQISNMTVTGAIAGDPVFIGMSAAAEVGLVILADCPTNDTVRIRAINTTSASINPQQRTFTVVVIK